ncbi:hypothetical protein M0802_008731 [Mischocyttarus mexicanus]|nr:hypothetical protein M0802_008731 [Mischocyttarus mexicanus]
MLTTGGDGGDGVVVVVVVVHPYELDVANLNAFNVLIVINRHEGPDKGLAVGHKRKVQNLLPCKSAAGAAAAAAAAASAAAAAGRTRVLPDCQSSHGGSGNTTSAAVLYEDLPDTMTRSQLHNHLPSHHHHHHPVIGGGQAPTIEVRATNPRLREILRDRQPLQAACTLRAPPAPHHLDYLDYRDPRAILRVTEKPSRAVLGGYRTPRALLAKSQEVSLSIATHVPRTISIMTNNINSNSSSSSNICQNENNSNNSNNNNELLNSHLILATQNALITSQQQPLPTPPPPPPPPPSPPLLLIPTSNSLSSSPKIIINNNLPNNISPFKDHEPIIRRHSVDSEGYSYIDFKDTELESLRSPLPPLPPPPPPPPPVPSTSFIAPTKSLKTSLRFSSSSSTASTSNYSSSSNILDSEEGYAYILDSWYNRKSAPGTARRIIADATEEEMCPLCTMQQIHQLLTRPEEIYLNVRDT